MSSIENRVIRQHYIPANHIGSFSNSTEGRARKRPIWVMRDGKTAPFQTFAQNVGLKNDLYTLKSSARYDSNFIDKSWSFVEANLPQAIQKLESYRADMFDILIWATVLVPFVAQLFVRGLNFKQHFLNTVPFVNQVYADDADALDDNVNQARLVDFQVNCALLLNAEWKLFRNTSKHPIILNDIGYTPFQDKENPELLGYAIPLTKNLLLMISNNFINKLNVPVATDGENVFFPIPSIELKDDVRGLNTMLAVNAHKEIYGPTKESVIDVWERRHEIPPQQLPIGVRADLLKPDGVHPTHLLDEYPNFLRFLGVPQEILKGALGGQQVVRLKRMPDLQMSVLAITSLD